MGPLELGVGLLERLRLSRLLPGPEIGAEGFARLCRSEHLGIWFEGMEERLVAQHLDISFQLWMKGRDPVGLDGVIEPQAAGQKLRQGPPIGGRKFRALTLGPGGTPVESHFQLQGREGDELRAKIGDEVSFGIRLGRNSRLVRVRVLVAG